MGSDDAFYCTELVYWASGLVDRDGDRPMIMPAELLAYGAVVYFSGRRDDPQLLRVASGWLDERASPGERRASFAAGGRAESGDRVAQLRPPAPTPGLSAALSTVDTTATSTGTFSVEGLGIQESGGL
jgi:hypothetical protein